MDIIFMGTPDFAKESLEALVEAGHNIKLVITNPDRPKGRGMKLQQSPVKEYALAKEIEVAQPEKIRNNKEIVEKIQDLNPDVICVVAYGKIIPNEILDIPRCGTINVHGSLLPKYRGAAPIQWAVLNGDKKTGITTMYVNEKMDEGDILLKEEVSIGDDESVGELWERLSIVGANLLVKTLVGIENNTIKRISQEGEGTATYAPMLEKSMAEIKWNEQGVAEIKNLVRGLNPIMGAYTFVGGKKLKFWKVKILAIEEFLKISNYNMLQYENSKCGDVVYNSKNELCFKGKDGVISVLEIQAENAKKMNIEDFLRGTMLNFGV